MQSLLAKATCDRCFAEGCNQHLYKPWTIICSQKKWWQTFGPSLFRIMFCIIFFGRDDFVNSEKCEDWKHFQNAIKLNDSMQSETKCGQYFFRPFPEKSIICFFIFRFWKNIIWDHCGRKICLHLILGYILWFSF